MDGEDLLRMRPREIKRLHLIGQALERKISQKQAAEVAGLSVRQMRRLMKRVEQRRSGHPASTAGKAVNPANRRHRSSRKCCRCLRSTTPIMGRPWPVRSCRNVIRLRCIPRPCGYGCVRLDCPTNSGKPDRTGSGGRCFGEMVQLDGSHHDWLEGRPKLVLMGYIDDATSTWRRVSMIMRARSRPWIVFGAGSSAGIPCSVYLDKHTTYRSPQTPTVEEQLQGRERSQSQFQRAMSELGVEVIHAHSSAAKGRVERLFQTLQDRLVKELRLAGARAARPTRSPTLSTAPQSALPGRGGSAHGPACGCRHDWISIRCFA